MWPQGQQNQKKALSPLAEEVLRILLQTDAGRSNVTGAGEGYGWGE